MEQKAISLRYRRNIILFIISYTISNMVSGIIYDTYVNYLQEAAHGVATSFWAYYGYASFVSAILLIFIPKIGYKSILVFCSVACTGALVAVVFLDAPGLFHATTLLSMVGLQLHYALLTPFIASYTTQENKIKWYSRTYYIGYIGYFLTTYLGGVLTVQLFALRAGETYAAAKKMTEYLEELTGFAKNAYLQGNRDVLLITAVLSALSILPVLLLRQDKADYRPQETRVSVWQWLKDAAKAITGKYALLYLVYWALINFGMGLFSSYYTVFLNRNLHIDKATSSLLVSISYIALVVFMIFTPAVVKKFGQVGTLGGVALLSIPFMLIIANGDRFGRFMIPVVGVALFMRSGLINLSSPVDSSLSMELVSRDLRPVYASAINFIASLASIASGHFTGKVLFVTQEGYRTAYYVAAVIYTIACTLLLVGLRRFNRTNEQEGSDGETA